MVLGFLFPSLVWRRRGYRPTPLGWINFGKSSKETPVVPNWDSANRFRMGKKEHVTNGGGYDMKQTASREDFSRIWSFHFSLEHIITDPQPTGRNSFHLGVWGCLGYALGVCWEKNVMCTLPETNCTKSPWKLCSSSWDLFLLNYFLGWTFQLFETTLSKKLTASSPLKISRVPKGKAKVFLCHQFFRGGSC